jgi:hypothetical protein
MKKWNNIYNKKIIFKTLFIISFLLNFDQIFKIILFILINYLKNNLILLKK